jgi:hypothetical protein
MVGLSSGLRHMGESARSIAPTKNITNKMFKKRENSALGAIPAGGIKMPSTKSTGSGKKMKMKK